MATKRAKKSGKKVSTLRAKSLSPKKAKSVKGGYEGKLVANYTLMNAWPTK